MEININIEGYNVNGICVGCLSYNRKMFYAKQIHECFKTLAEIDVPEEIAIQLCWECLAVVDKIFKFKEKILKSYKILHEYSQKHTYLNNPTDLSKHSTTNFYPFKLEVFDIPDCKEEKEIELQTMDIEFDPKDIVQDGVKEEVIDAEIKWEPDFDDSVYLEELPAPDQDSDDDDLSLSKLKKKKKKKRKASIEKTEIKHHKPIESDATPNERKLKNLPDNLVELYQMDEEEMSKVRSDDVASEDFQKIRYKCERCVLGFNTEKLMIEHTNGKHKPKDENCYQCDICKSYFLTKDRIATHRALHMTAYRCRECKYVTSLKRLMSKHVKRHDSGSMEMHPCPTCHEKFTTKYKLNYHKTVCKQSKPQCDCCGKVFANKVTLKYHLKISPQNKEDREKEKQVIPCKGCHKVFHSRKSYLAHVVIHNGQKYPCPLCGKLFLWKRNLARHTRNHREREEGALHECRECRKTFSSKDCYNNHMRLSKRHVGEETYSYRAPTRPAETTANGAAATAAVVVDERQFLANLIVEELGKLHVCNYCGKKFATKWCMVDHVDWDHLKRIKYQCRICMKAFKTAKIMVAHENHVHGSKKKDQDQKESEHLCEICGKSYKTVKRLKGHVWSMHTNRSTSKSFKCKLCPATFTWQTSIYKHMKMMHCNKRSKQPLVIPPPPPPKVEPYPGIELANRIQYY